MKSDGRLTVSTPHTHAGPAFAKKEIISPRPEKRRVEVVEVPSMAPLHSAAKSDKRSDTLRVRSQESETLRPLDR